MILKKFYGTTIQQALKSAKEQLGDHVILLESVAANGDGKAQVTVMLDEKLASTAEETPEQKQDPEFRNVFYKRSDVQKASAPEKKSEDSRAKRTDEQSEASKKAEKRKSVAKDSEEDQSKEKNAAKTTDQRKKLGLKKGEKTKRKVQETQDDDHLPEPKGLDAPGSSMSRRERPLIKIEHDNGGHRAVSRDSTTSREISAVHHRLAQLESMLAESLISANLDYASHPTFQQLLKAGVRGTTISGWFKEIMNVGVDPFENKETFLFEMGKIIRNAITIDEPRVAQPNMVFVGASGAGKTTMIMKLVEHPDFFAQKRVAIVSVIPRNSHQKYSILEPFSRDHNLDYYQVKDGIDVSKLMKKLVEYDHVLFDTPSISLEKETAFREYWKIRQILASVMPLEVHFVVNASMEQFYFRETYAANHPLQPDYVAITHLDETQRWGHLIPFLKTLGCGVRYLSMGTQVPDDVHAFSPTWFAEQILSRAN